MLFQICLAESLGFYLARKQVILSSFRFIYQTRALISSDRHVFVNIEKQKLDLSLKTPWKTKWINQRRIRFRLHKSSLAHRTSTGTRHGGEKKTSPQVSAGFTPAGRRRRQVLPRNCITHGQYRKTPTAGTFCIRITHGTSLSSSTTYAVVIEWSGGAWNDEMEKTGPRTHVWESSKSKTRRTRPRATAAVIRSRISRARRPGIMIMISRGQRRISRERPHARTRRAFGRTTTCASRGSRGASPERRILWSNHHGATAGDFASFNARACVCVHGVLHHTT